MRKAIIIGLTGQTGAGKTTAADMLRKFGYGIVDADRTAARVTEKGSPVLEALASNFGQDIKRADGTLDRKLLAERAFADEKHTKLLNDITHPEIVRLIMKKVEGKFRYGFEGVVIDAPQLFESGLSSECSLIISVTAPESVRLKRIMERDGMTEEDAEKRMHAQLSEDFFKEHSDIIIINDGSTEYLHEQMTQAARIIEARISGE